MPGRNLPISTDSMVRGDGYFTPESPSDDSAPGAGRRDSTTKPDLPQGQPSQCEVVSHPTLVGSIPGWRVMDGAHGVQSSRLQRFDEKRGVWVTVKGGR